MDGREKVDYSNIDPWIKDNPQATLKEFKKANPKVSLSHTSFNKRKKIVLGIPLSPSLMPGYRRKGRPAKSSEDSTPKVKRAYRQRQPGVYSTVWSTPVEGLNKKSNVENIQDMISHMNSTFKLSLEVVQITLVGSGVQMMEIRKYSK